MGGLLFSFLVWVLGFGVLGYIMRKLISSFFIEKVHLPQYINFLLIALPFVIVEEAITCGFFPLCLLITIPAFWLHLTIFYLFIKYIKFLLSYEWLSIFLYGVWGSIGEFIINGKMLQAIAEGHTAVTISILVILNTLIYMVIIIIPIHYVIANKESNQYVSQIQ